MSFIICASLRVSKMETLENIGNNLRQGRNVATIKLENCDIKCSALLPCYDILVQRSCVDVSLGSFDETNGSTSPNIINVFLFFCSSHPRPHNKRNIYNCLELLQRRQELEHFLFFIKTPQFIALLHKQ